MTRKQLVLRKGRDASVRRFHPWVFSGALARAAKDIAAEIAEGEVVELRSASGELLALGHYASGSIAVRIFSFLDVQDIPRFLAERFRAALAIRQRLPGIGTATTAYRLINAEGDGLPGLVIDLYGTTAVLQLHSEGMRRWRAQIVDALRAAMPDLTEIVDRSPAADPRERSAATEPAAGTTVEIREHGLRFEVDCVHGQKTGFFLDQRDNRKLLMEFSRERKLLNTFCYTGGFSVYALAGGARVVRSVDASEAAIAQLERNLALNSLTGNQSTVADCLELLPRLDEEYDLVVLDPPAFVKHQGALKGGLRGYDSINYHALRKIAPGGIIFTFSCSQFVDRALFAEVVQRAAQRAGRFVRVLHQLGPAACHPVSAFHPEGDYLKGLVLLVE